MIGALELHENAYPERFSVKKSKKMPRFGFFRLRLSQTGLNYHLLVYFIEKTKQRDIGE